MQLDLNTTYHRLKTRVFPNPNFQLPQRTITRPTNEEVEYRSVNVGRFLNKPTFKLDLHLSLKPTYIKRTSGLELAIDKQPKKVNMYNHNQNHCHQPANAPTRERIKAISFDKSFKEQPTNQIQSTKKS